MSVAPYRGKSGTTKGDSIVNGGQGGMIAPQSPRNPFTFLPKIWSERIGKLRLCPSGFLAKFTLGPLGRIA